MSFLEVSCCLFQNGARPLRGVVRFWRTSPAWLGGGAQNEHRAQGSRTSLTETSKEEVDAGKLRSLSYDYTFCLIYKVCTEPPRVSDEEILFLPSRFPRWVQEFLTQSLSSLHWLPVMC